MELPAFDLPYELGLPPKVLRFHLADPGFQPTMFHERHLDGTFASYLNYTAPVTCDGYIYIVVESRETRIAEYYVAVGEKEGFPPSGEPGIASIEEARDWAQGKNPAVGTYCKRRGYYERG